MINEFDIPDSRSRNFEACRKAMERLSVADIVRAYDYIYLLRTLIAPDNEALDNFNEVVAPLAKVLRECQTEKSCPSCKQDLFLSDLPQYDYLCVECEENFVEGEV